MEPADARYLRRLERALARVADGPHHPCCAEGRCDEHCSVPVACRALGRAAATIPARPRVTVTHEEWERDPVAVVRRMDAEGAIVTVLSANGDVALVMEVA